MEKRRRFRRLDIDEPVGIHVGDSYKVEKARELSEGGLLFQSNQSFKTGQIITLTFQLSDTILVKLEGEVIHISTPTSEGKVVGVKFQNTDEKQVKLVLDYFSKRGTA